jgi:hypothetical protein
VKNTNDEAHHYTSFCVVGPNILLSTLIAQTSVSLFFLWSEIPSFKPIISFINFGQKPPVNTDVKREFEGQDTIFLVSVNI